MGIVNWFNKRRAAKKLAQVEGFSLGDFVTSSREAFAGFIETIEIFEDGSVEFTVVERDEEGGHTNEHLNVDPSEVRVMASKGEPTPQPKFPIGSKVGVADGPYKGSYGIVNYMFNRLDNDKVTGWRVVVEFESETLEYQGTPIPSPAIPEEYLTPWQPENQPPESDELESWYRSSQRNSFGSSNGNR